MKTWTPCQRGYPDPRWCPKHTPMWSERCYDTGWDWARECRVVGTHDVNLDGEIIHCDGKGMRWAYERTV